MKKIISIVGTRPNIIKSALVSHQLKNYQIEEKVVHTGQHYDYELSKLFIDDLDLKPPDFSLDVGSGSHAFQTGEMMIAIEKILIAQNPSAVLIYGDTNSTLAGALAAAKIYIPLIHVEAGERRLDKKNPEEINRIICDHISQINCCATKKAVEFLKKEGIKKGAFFTGDVMLDLFLKYRKKAKLPQTLPRKKYILLTLHREENTSNNQRLTKITKSLGKIPQQIIWPIHPRSQKAVKDFKIHLPKNITTINPVSYSQMIALEANSKCIITDSGGVQKEAYWLEIPCITLMGTTGWTDTLTGGWNQLAQDPSRIKSYLNLVPNGRPDIKRFGNGNAAGKICRLIQKTI